MDKIQLVAFILMVTWDSWNLFVNLIKHGQTKECSVLTISIASLIGIGLLYLGGFFVIFGGFQIAWLVITLIGVFAMFGGYLENNSFNFWSTAFATIIIWFLYLKGGFWFTGFTPF